MPTSPDQEKRRKYRKTHGILNPCTKYAYRIYGGISFAGNNCRQNGSHAGSGSRLVLALDIGEA